MFQHLMYVHKVQCNWKIENQHTAATKGWKNAQEYHTPFRKHKCSQNFLYTQYVWM